MVSQCTTRRSCTLYFATAGRATVVYTVEAEDGRTRQVAVPLSTFPPSQFVINFVIPYLLAVVYLVAGVWVYWRRPQTRIGQAFAVFCCAVAIVIGTVFDLNTTHRLVRLWCAALPLATAAVIHLALVCPQERKLVQRWPALCFTPYLPALVLAVINELYLYDTANPRAHFFPWLMSYIFAGLGMAIFTSLLIHARQRPASSVVRQKARIILLGTVLAFGPTAVWIVASLLGDRLSASAQLSAAHAFPPGHCLRYPSLPSAERGPGDQQGVSLHFAHHSDPGSLLLPDSRRTSFPHRNSSQ